MQAGPHVLAPRWAKIAATAWQCSDTRKLPRKSPHHDLLTRRYVTDGEPSDACHFDQLVNHVVSVSSL